jgi:hypothetical protein
MINVASMKAIVPEFKSVNSPFESIDIANANGNEAKGSSLFDS